MKKILTKFFGISIVAGASIITPFTMNVNQSNELNIKNVKTNSNSIINNIDVGYDIESELANNLNIKYTKTLKSETNNKKVGLLNYEVDGIKSNNQKNKIINIELQNKSNYYIKNASFSNETIEEAISKNVHSVLNIKSWSDFGAEDIQFNSSSQSNSTRNFKNYFGIQNIKQTSYKNSFYQLSNYSYDYKLKNFALENQYLIGKKQLNFNLIDVWNKEFTSENYFLDQDGDHYLWDQGPKGKASVRYRSNQNSNLITNLNNIIKFFGSYSNFKATKIKFNDYVREQKYVPIRNGHAWQFQLTFSNLKNGYFELDLSKLKNKTIKSIDFFVHFWRVGTDVYSRVDRFDILYDGETTPQYIEVPWNPNYDGFSRGQEWGLYSKNDLKNRFNNFKFSYQIEQSEKITSYVEYLSLIPNSILRNEEFNNINEFKVVNNIDAFKLLKINLNLNNTYSNNGSVWSKAPELSFGVNEDLLVPAYELYKLKELHNTIQDDLAKNTLTKQQRISLNNLYISLQNRTDTYKNFKQKYDDLFSTGKNIPYDSNTNYISLYNEYVSNDGYGVEISSDINNWDEQWNIITSLFKSNDIYMNYSTPNSTEIKSAKIWDKKTKKFNPITATSNENRNENFIKLSSMEVKNGLSSSLYNPSEIKYDTTYTNITKGNNGQLIYNFLYRQSAKNYQNFDITTRSIDSRSIQLPFDKYASEVVKSDNDFVDPTGGEVLKALNSVIKSDVDTEVFSQASTINDDTNINRFTNWNDALDYFGIPHTESGRVYDELGRPSFSRNDSDGIFYTLAKINGWKLDEDTDNSIASGNFSQKFVQSLRTNKDIYELDLFNKTGNQGWFLVKVKSNKTTTSINPINDLESWNPTYTDTNSISTDIRNPLNIFNTSTNNQNIINFFKNTNNLSLKTEQTVIDSEDGYRSIITTTNTYSIDKNKEFELKLDKFGGTFTHDYWAYENGMTNDGYEMGEHPTLEQDFLKKVFNSYWNESVDNDGKIVYRYEIKSPIGNQKKYTYVLKDQYQLNLEEDMSYYSKYIVKYDAYITNKSKTSEFNLNTTIGNIIDMFEKQYSNNSNEALKNEWSANKQKINEYIEKNLNSTTTKTEIKPQQEPVTNSASKNITPVALGISVPILLLVIGAMIAYIVYSKIRQKKYFDSFNEEPKNNKK